jgi:alpha-N-arabinofuranosidase
VGGFFENLNFGADGLIYAELIENRSFEFTRPRTGWSFAGEKPQQGGVLVINENTSTVDCCFWVKQT